VRLFVFFCACVREKREREILRVCTTDKYKSIERERVCIYTLHTSIFTYISYIEVPRICAKDHMILHNSTDILVGHDLARKVLFSSGIYTFHRKARLSGKGGDRCSQSVEEEEESPKEYLPSVIQIRCLGHKGIVMLSEEIPKDCIEIRESMSKFVVPSSVGVCLRFQRVCMYLCF